MSTHIRFALVVAALFAVAVAGSHAWGQFVEVKITPNDSHIGHFGYSVAIDGDTAIIGDIGQAQGAGRAYVFTRQGACWIQHEVLIPFNSAPGDRFGVSAAIDGDTAVIGASDDDPGGLENAGAAHIFQRFSHSNSWGPVTTLIASDAAANDNLGAVSIDGSTVIVSSAGDDHAGGTNAGSAYIFTNSKGNWTQQAKLIASDATHDHFFGSSVSIQGDTAIVGAVGDAHSGVVYAGAAYIFTRSGNVWTEQAKLTAPDPTPYASFGGSVALSGDTAIIGANGDSHDAGTYAGSAYIFIRTDGTWTQQAKVTSSDSSGYDFFGIAVSIVGEKAIIGADLNDPGSAYLFSRSDTTWTQQAQLTESDEKFTYFGHSVSFDGDAVIVGASLDGPTGSAYVFQSDASNPADITCDGSINVDDLFVIINAWGWCGLPCLPHSSCTGDINDDCFVNVDDLLAVINNWS